MENRNLKNRSTIQKLSSFCIVCLFVLIGVASNANIARADPHGIYYTAVGQQQLFFNVLAALDQADYVETALAREEKREAREAVDTEPKFVRESESGAKLTKETELKQDDNEAYPPEPGEPDLVNRQITLEGADIYTDQLVRQFGAESARRNAAAELLQALCANGFGFEDCDYDLSGKNPRQQLAIENRRRSATIIDPLAWASLPTINGIWHALNSGNMDPNVPDPDPNNALDLIDEEYRAKKKANPDLYGYEPIAFSKDIATWRYFINSGLAQGNVSIHKEALNNHLNDTYKIYDTADPIIYPYQEYNFNDSINDYTLVGLVRCGETWCMNPSPPSWSIANNPESNTVISYLAAVNRMKATGIRSIDDIAAKAAQRIATQQRQLEDEGVLAKTTLVAHPASIPGIGDPPANDPGGTPPPVIISQYGELSVNIDVPVAAREASIYGIPNVLGMLATSQQTSSLEGLDIPGSVQLVKRADSSPEEPECNNSIDDDEDGYIDYGSDPECASLTDTSESIDGEQSLIITNGPQVAGTLDYLFNDTFIFFDEKKEETSPSANLISPLLEFGARHALRVLTAGEWRQEQSSAGPTCGFTCD